MGKLLHPSPRDHGFHPPRGSYDVLRSPQRQFLGCDGILDHPDEAGPADCLVRAGKRLHGGAVRGADDALKEGREISTMSSSNFPKESVNERSFIDESSMTTMGW